MKKKENEVRKLFVKIRMNEEELNCVKKFQEQTTEKSLSEYMRSVSMRKPVTVNYRNQSADDFLKQMLALKKELNAIGNNSIRQSTNCTSLIKYLSSGFGYRIMMGYLKPW